MRILTERKEHLESLKILLENKIKNLIVMKALMVALSLVLTVSTSSAEMAKEGSGDYRSAKAGTISMLPTDDERVQINFEELSIVVGAPEICPLLNASFRDMGTKHAINGKSTITGFIVYTIPNGDRVYGTIEAEGVLAQGGSTGIVEFVGGTGTCTGISGTIEYKPGPQIKPAKEGNHQAITVGRVNWKIP